MTEDTVLLRHFVEDHSDAAFAELVRRHVNLVYFAAVRRLDGDTHLAEEAAQAVFALLARKAGSLTRHPTLTGWLYVATQNAVRELVRAETRRHQREEQAHAMEQDLRPSPAEPDWDQVRPVIDDALAELDVADRDAVLLRFFENRRFGEIAAVLRTSENAARMRVDRAVDKLRTALARRGVTSTTAALTAALAVPAGTAAPAALAPQISAAVLVATATTVGGTLGSAFLTIMTSAKLTVIATGVAAIAIGLAVHQHHQLTATRAELATANARVAQQRKLVENLEWRLTSAHEQQVRVATAAGRSPGGAPDALAAPANPVTRDQVEARLARAKEHAAAGRYDDALREYLWCYDVGMRQVEGYFIMRYSAVLDAIGELAKKHPPTIDALRQRRDAAKARLLASQTDMEASKDYAQLNRVLGDNEATFAMFDSLAEDDPRRGHLIDMNMGRLMEARRYREFAKAMPYGGIPQVWEQIAQVARSLGISEDARPRVLQQATGFAAAQIEIRAGAGDLVSASDMIERLLIFDNSPETTAEIKRRLQRAGHPELFTGP